MARTRKTGLVSHVLPPPRRPRKPKVVVTATPVEARPVIDEAELRHWRERLATWEETIIADARLLGELPIIDYRDRPFVVPPEIDAELQRRRNPSWGEGLRSKVREAQNAAEHRRSLAAMLREKGDEVGALTQEEAAAGFDREALRAAHEAAEMTGVRS